MALFGRAEELLEQVRPGTRLARGLTYLRDYREGRLPEVENIVRRQKNGDKARVEIQGEALFALIQCYPPRAREESLFEAHQRYTDLQYLCEGREWIEVCDLKSQEGLSPFDADGNVYFPLTREVHTRLLLQPEQVAVLSPDDAHAPCLRVGDAEALVRKIVIKVLDAEMTDGA